MVIEGDMAMLGSDALRGVELALEDFKTLYDHNIELVKENTGCNFDTGGAVASRLASDPSIIGVIGTSCSSSAVSAIDILSPAGLVLISPVNSAPSLTDPNNHQAGYFRTSINDAWHGELIAQFAYNKLNARRLVTIRGEDDLSSAIQQAACTTFQNLGGSCVLQEVVPTGTKDLTDLMTKITQAAPDAIFLPIFEPEADEIIMKVRSAPGLSSIALLGTDSFYSKEVVAITNGAANGMYLSSVIPVESGDLAKRYNERYGEPLTGDRTASAYDATMLLLNAVNVVAYPVDGVLYIPRQAIRDTLHAVQNYDGKSGTLTCDVYGDCADRNRLQIIQIQDGQMVRMYP